MKEGKEEEDEEEEEEKEDDGSRSYWGIRLAALPFLHRIHTVYEYIIIARSSRLTLLRGYLSFKVSEDCLDFYGLQAMTSTVLN